MSLAPPLTTTGVNSTQFSVVVIGSTGAVGRYLIHHLLRNSQISAVYSFVRRLDTFQQNGENSDIIDPSWDLSKLHEIQIPAEFNADAVDALWPNDPTIFAAFSSLGTTAKQAGDSEGFVKVDFGMNDVYFTTARKNGIRNAQLISSVGADNESGNLYLKTKGRLEKRLIDLGFDHVDIYRPGILDNTHRPSQPSRCAESCAVGMMKYMCCCFLPNCFGEWRPIDVEQIAYLMDRNVTNLKNKNDDNGPIGEDILESQHGENIGDTYQTTQEDNVTIYQGSQHILNAIDVVKKRQEQELS
jgi:hypothetical protein